MSYFRFDFLGQSPQSLLHQTAKEVHLFEDVFVWLFEVLNFVVWRQVLHKARFFLDVRKFLDVWTLFYKIINLPIQIFRNLIFLSQPFKDFQVFVHFLVYCFYTADQSAYAANIVGQDNAANYFYEYHH